MPMSPWHLRIAASPSPVVPTRHVAPGGRSSRAAVRTGWGHFLAVTPGTGSRGNCQSGSMVRPGPPGTACGTCHAAHAAAELARLWHHGCQGEPACAGCWPLVSLSAILRCCPLVQ